MKTPQELALHFWNNVFPLKELCMRSYGIDIPVYQLVKVEGTCISFMPEFSLPKECYSFAVSIVEGEPVFPEDIVYNKRSGQIWEGADILDPLNWTWVKPTITLNGIEIPKPDPSGTYGVYIGNVMYLWKNKQDRDIVTKALHELLGNV